MAYYINRVTLRGKISMKVKYSKTVDGNEFCSFNIEMNNNQQRTYDKTARDTMFYLHIMVFKKEVVEYLKRNNAKQNDVVTIEGRLNCKRVEMKGIEFYQTNIIAHDIQITK